MKNKIRVLALKTARAIYHQSNTISVDIERFYSNKKIGANEESLAQIFVFIVTILLIVPLLILLGLIKKQA